MNIKIRQTVCDVGRKNLRENQISIHAVMID